jgi:glycosyltransferase involved in cell wall biosynthesis
MGLNEVMLSIITINRNNAEGLRRTIESVLGQTYNNYEYIVIDGNSTDGSQHVIAKFAERIAYSVSEKDTGIYNAMNKGILKAKGNYCLFLNSGDWLKEVDILDKTFAESRTEDILFGNIIYEGEKEAMVFPDIITLNTFLGPSIGHGASFIKRYLFDNYGLYNEQNKIVSDWEFFVKVFLIHKCSYKHINNTVTIYQKGGISTNALHNEVQILERNAVLKREFPELYDTIRENFELKEQLNYYTHSRLVQLVKKLQHSRLYKLRNKHLR